jgi:uncharacterized lipoprotein YajG
MRHKLAPRPGTCKTPPNRIVTENLMKKLFLAASLLALTACGEQAAKVDTAAEQKPTLLQQRRTC